MSTTWQEMVDAVCAAQHDLTGGNEAEPLWYRRQSDASWKLTPSLFRLNFEACTPSSTGTTTAAGCRSVGPGAVGERNCNTGFASAGDD